MPGYAKVTSVTRLEGEAKVAPPSGPPTIRHEAASVPPAGSPSSLAEPLSVTVFAGTVIDWSGPASTTGAWFGVRTVTTTSSVASRSVSLAVRRRT